MAAKEIGINTKRLKQAPRDHGILFRRREQLVARMKISVEKLLPGAPVTSTGMVQREVSRYRKLGICERWANHPIFLQGQLLSAFYGTVRYGL